MRLSSILLGACWALLCGGAYGCWHQFQGPPIYQLSSSVQQPVGGAYPGTRELMDAPSNDPALNNDRNGVELRP
jgi:hypothetical protein